MKHTLLLLTLVSLFTCKPQHTENPQVLTKVLTDYFDGIKHRYLNKLNTVTTTNLNLFADGMEWKNDSLISNMSDLKTIDGTWTCTNVKASIDGSSGEMIYSNHGELVANDTLKRSVDWVESATFRKVDGQWKL